MRAVAWMLLPYVFTAVMGCEAASPDSDLLSWLRIDSAQLVLGPPPADQGGPVVQGVTLLQSRVWPGQQGKPISGTLATSATAVSLFLVGDRTHYILPAGTPDITAPESPTFVANLDFSPLLPLGPHQIQLQATDETGRYGAITAQSLMAESEPPPDGVLVFVLRWERAADLDLHVEEPSGQEIWARRKSGNTAPAPGRPPPGPNAGYLDFDSNAQCVIDGRQREQVIYRTVAPQGRYKVRVDSFSLCGQPTAYWQSEVWRHGRRIAVVDGQSVPSDTRGSHTAGAGTLALDIEIR
jgi:hypothetical protein